MPFSATNTYQGGGQILDLRPLQTCALVILRVANTMDSPLKTPLSHPGFMCFCLSNHDIVQNCAKCPLFWCKLQTFCPEDKSPWREKDFVCFGELFLENLQPICGGAQKSWWESLPCKTVTSKLPFPLHGLVQVGWQCLRSTYCSQMVAIKGPGCFHSVTVKNRALNDLCVCCIPSV